MKTMPKITKKFTAFAVALTLALLNCMSVSAQTAEKEKVEISTMAEIPSFGNHTVSGGTPHYSSGIGIRANQRVRLNVNLVSSSGDSGLTAIVYKSNGSSTGKSARFYSSGTYDFYLSEGGSYYIAFNCRSGSSYTFNYTITY